MTEEIALIELLTPIDTIAIKAIEKEVLKCAYHFVKSSFEYRYVKAKLQDELLQINWSTPVIVMKRE